MPETTAIIISIIALASSALTSVIHLFTKIKKSDCIRCQYETRGSDDVIIEAIQQIKKDTNEPEPSYS